MSKRLILTDKLHHGKNLTIPVDGMIEIDQDGGVLVSDEAAAILLTIEGWVKAKDGSDMDEDENINEEDSEAMLDTQWLEEVDLDELTKLSLDELNEIAQAGKIKNYKKFGANRVALAKYIKSQLNKKKK